MSKSKDIWSAIQKHRTTTMKKIKANKQKLLPQQNLCLSGAQKASADVYPLRENKVFSHWNAML